VDIQPQPPFFDPPFLSCDTGCFALNRCEETDVTLPEIPYAPDRATLDESHKVERSDGLQVPFHIGKDHELWGRIEDLLLLRDPREDVLDPMKPLSSDQCEVWRRTIWSSMEEMQGCMA